VTSADRSPEVEGAQRSAADLEAADSRPRRSEKVQSALFRIAELASAAQDMQDFYRAVHSVVGELMYANNLYIALYDEERQLISFPYYVDEVDPDIPDPNQWDAFGEGDAKGPTAYVLRTGEPQLLSYERTRQLQEQGALEPVGLISQESSWLGVPLSNTERTVGVLAVQSYTTDIQFTDEDRDLLAFVGQHVGAALSRARAIEETRQRNAELALINSVQEALAGELELQAIYDVVGEKLRDVFDAQIIDIAVFDEATGLIHFPYTVERGVRYPDEPTPLTELGFRRHVMETGETLLVNRGVREAAGRFANPVLGSGEMPKSVLYVPLAAGGKATGAISLQNADREHAFTDSDVRLLETLTSSLSVALENARLIHETRRRNAELALINSVQAAIAGELDPQRIFDLAGSSIDEVYDAQVVSISTYDPRDGILRFPYVIERGERLAVDPMPVVGFRKHVLETAEPLLVNEDVVGAAERHGNPLSLAGEVPKSALFVPLVSGGRAAGVISLQNVDREHAFSESDQRLLATLAGSISAALENARLVHETRERAAELSTVNSVGRALASQLDLDALIELVGERVRETFDADIAYVALHHESAATIEFPYYHESGERRAEPPMEYGEGLTSQILESRQPLLLNREAQYEGVASVGTPSRSYLGVPILAGDRAIGVISVQSVDQEGRFGEAETGLLATIASNVGVAIQNARLFAEIGRQKQYLESLVEITPVAVVTMDAEECVTGWNPAAAELFGFTPAEALGRHVDDLVFGDDSRDEGREITREALERGRAHRITRRRRKDGSPLDVELMLVPLTGEGERLGFLGIYHDITELQRAREEAEAATYAKSAFLATMSHEIRTPMNAVIGMTDLLLGTELAPEQREFAGIVRSSGEALLHVIDDILDYSKIEAGKLELERAPFDLRECVEAALEIVAPRAWEKQIELGCLIDENAPPGIVGDAARLRQVLLNLLSNAVKFTEHGEVVVVVDAEPAGPGASRLTLAVRDTGIGIPQDRMDRLFASFSQVDASTTRRYGGTGLGLAISKRLVELMGGTIWVESEPGTGSTFGIALSAEVADVPQQIAADEGLPQLRGKRILVVDDNATNREIVSRHARSWGMQPVAVERPAEALQLIAAGELFDVAVLDMMMPDMDGVTLAHEIRTHTSARRLPLLLLTSLGRLPGDGAAAFDAQLAKPMRASQLYNALIRLVAPAGQQEETVETAPAGAPRTSSLRILLAEDNAVNQKVALRLLERLGYRADVVWNGLEALRALERTTYDVVLMDVQMPELDGLETSRRIGEHWPAQARPHIIAMTANALPEDRAACFAAGMQDYVAKPIRPEELAEALKRVRPIGRDIDGGSAETNGGLEVSALDSLRELGGDEFVAEVIDTFLADAPGLLETLRSSLDVGDADELRRAAHSLKSNGATLGAGEFSQACRDVEQRAKERRLDGAGELVERIERAYGPLTEALANQRPNTAS
jgi:PAS domain S-box-containing protein